MMSIYIQMFLEEKTIIPVMNVATIYQVSDSSWCWSIINVFLWRAFDKLISGHFTELQHGLVRNKTRDKSWVSSVCIGLINDSQFDIFILWPAKAVLLGQEEFK